MDNLERKLMESPTKSSAAEAPAQATAAPSSPPRSEAGTRAHQEWIKQHGAIQRGSPTLIMGAASIEARPEMKPADVQELQAEIPAAQHDPRGNNPLSQPDTDAEALQKAAREATSEKNYEGMDDFLDGLLGNGQDEIVEAKRSFNISCINDPESMMLTTTCLLQQRQSNSFRKQGVKDSIFGARSVAGGPKPRSTMPS